MSSKKYQNAYTRLRFSFVAYIGCFMSFIILAIHKAVPPVLSGGLIILWAASGLTYLHALGVLAAKANKSVPIWVGSAILFHIIGVTATFIRLQNWPIAYEWRSRQQHKINGWDRFGIVLSCLWTLTLIGCALAGVHYIPSASIPPIKWFIYFSPSEWQSADIPKGFVEIVPHINFTRLFVGISFPLFIAWIPVRASAKWIMKGFQVENSKHP